MKCVDIFCLRKETFLVGAGLEECLRKETLLQVQISCVVANFCAPLLLMVCGGNHKS